MGPAKPQLRSQTLASLIALVAGLSVSWLMLHFNAPVLATAAAFLESIGLLWVTVLRLTVIPIIITQLFLAVVTTSDARAFRRLGTLSMLVFVGLLILALLFTLIIVPQLLSMPSFEDLRLAPGQTRGPGPAGTAIAPGENLKKWLSPLVPDIAGAVTNNLLIVMLATLVFAAACTQIAPELRQVLVSFFRAVDRAVFVILNWLIRFVYLGIFAFALAAAARSGFDAGKVLVMFAVIVSALIFLFTFLLYPITSLVGRVSLRAFARAVLPAQVVAVGTRSSLACVPALMENAERVLVLPASVTGFVLPFAAAAFKVNRTISGPAEFLFLAHVFRVELTPAQIATYLLAVFLASFSTVGIPSGGMPFKDLPFIVAAGIPVEGYIMLHAIDVIPDLFKTVLNVTGYMSASAIVARFAPVREPARAQTQSGREPLPAGKQMPIESSTGEAL